MAADDEWAVKVRDWLPGRSRVRPAPGMVGPGRRIYAIGDVHGCASRLRTMHGLIAAELERNPPAEAFVVHLGDYIDRGPDSAGVVALLGAAPGHPGVVTTNLRGNHEQMMLDALTGEAEAVAHWVDNGAVSTLRSWHIPATSPPASWREALPAADMARLEATRQHHRIDGYLFVHAGVRPGVALGQQTHEDLLWIREAFLDHRGPLLPDAPDLAIVHGHTPQTAPTVTGNRIGIDTGAVNGGPLTCAVLEGRTVRFLAA